MYSCSHHYSRPHLTHNAHLGSSLRHILRFLCLACFFSTHTIKHLGAWCHLNKGLYQFPPAKPETRTTNQKKLKFPEFQALISAFAEIVYIGCCKWVRPLGCSFVVITFRQLLSWKHQNKTHQNRNQDKTTRQQEPPALQEENGNGIDIDQHLQLL